MTTPSAAVVVSTRIGLGAAEPYVDKLLDLGYEVSVYCLGDFKDTARSLWRKRPVQVVDLGVPPDPWWSYLHSRAAFMLSELQPGLNPDQRREWTHRSTTGRRIRAASRRLLSRFSASSVNRFLSHGAARAGRRFNEDVVVVVTTSSRPWLHASGGPPTISVMESWDHPVRKTAGYRTDVIIAWNEDTGNDWVRFQGAGLALVGGPWKLAYAIEAFPLTSLTNERERPRLLYAVGTSSANAAWYEAEHRLVNLVAQAAAEAGWDVTLKLKPNGGPSDYSDLADRFVHVRLTGEQASPNPMDYHLSDEYNALRLRELASVDLVVNAVTTFALDAACAGVPVLQLDAFTGEGLAGIRSASRNYHLQTYLLNVPDQVLSVDSSTLTEELSAWLRQPDRRAVEFSERLRAWLLPKGGLSATANNALRSALVHLGLPAEPVAHDSALPETGNLH